MKTSANAKSEIVGELPKNNNLSEDWTIGRDGAITFMEDGHRILIADVDNFQRPDQKVRGFLMTAAPQLERALRFCVSVMKDQGIFDLSEKMAVEMAEKAIAEANKSGSLSDF